MLILTRRIGESIMIGDDVVVTVLGVQGNQVKIGIDAPKNVRVDREEIYRKIQAEKNAAEKSGSSDGDAQPTSNYNNSYTSNTQSYNTANTQSYAPNTTKSYTPSSHNYSSSPSSYSPAVVGGTDYDDQYSANKSTKSQPEIIVKKKRVLSGQEA